MFYQPPVSFVIFNLFIVNGESSLSLISGRWMQTNHMFFVLFISLLYLLWGDNIRITLDVNSLMVWFTILSDNYSSRLLSFTWHFLSAAPDEIAVYHFACYASTLFRYVGHHIPLSCLTFSLSILKSIEHALSCGLSVSLWF